MQYFFILGANPTLSLAELTSIFLNGRFSLIQKNIAILETNQTIEANILKKIGGVVKFGLIHNNISSLAAQNILKAMSIFSQPEEIKAKFKFGISHYGRSKINLKVLGMEFKKLLKQAGLNSRWVISREPVLSSVVVEQNKLITAQGAEIVMIEFNKKLFLGKTLAVQPFKELSFRDYGRPARDDRSGMLPPKLAQIMLNLALPPSPYQGEGRGEVILDPFCGSGTIITEAMLMGYQNVIATDILNKAIEDTKENVEWIKKNFQFSIRRPPADGADNFQTINASANQISKYLAPNSVDAIVTEPYLGPPRGRIEFNKIKLELEKLYSDSLRKFHKILKPTGKIVMIWPIFNLSLRSSFVIPAQAGIQNFMVGALNPNLNGFTIINPIPENLRKNIFLNLTARQTIIYGREGQKVWREIVILEKNN